MDLLTQPLTDLRAQVAGVVRDAISERAYEQASEQELARHVAAIAEVGRLVEAMLVGAVADVMRRSENPRPG